MLKSFRLLGHSIRNFGLGFGPGLALAFLCLIFQIGLWTAAGSVLRAFFPPEPFDPTRFEVGDWRDTTRHLLNSTFGRSLLFFFHALVALILTAWLLRRRAGFKGGEVFRRAVRGAGVLAGAAAVLFAIAFVLSDILAATRFLRFDFQAAATLLLWFGGTALLLPARLMGYEPAAATGLPRTTLMVALVLVPWFFASEAIGAPLRNCVECWGLFEGGMFAIPLLGAYLLGLTVSSAAVSAAACTELAPASA